MPSRIAVTSQFGTEQSGTSDKRFAPPWAIANAEQFRAAAAARPVGPVASAMPTKQHVLCLIDSCREICRPSLIGMQFFYQRAMRATDFFGGSPRRKAKDLIGFVFAHITGVSCSRAGTRI